MTQEYLGWRYGYNRRTNQFFVVPPFEVVAPKSFFKYYSLSDYSIDALTNMYVYASHPAQLNDPFDCDVNLARIEDNASARYLLQGLYQEARMLSSTDSQFFDYSSEIFTTIEFAKLGILSLTDSCTNPVMWSLYSENKGFCLEFDISEFPFPYYGPFPIHYVEKIVHASSKVYDVATLAAIQSNVKRKCWSHENEWRLLIQNPSGLDMVTYGKYSNEVNKSFPNLHNRKFGYPISSLKSITLGVNFFKEIQERNRLFTTGSTEVKLNYPNVCNQTKVLDFLYKVSDSLKVNLIYKDGLNFELINVKVLKDDDITYRIVEQ